MQNIHITNPDSEPGNEPTRAPRPGLRERLRAFGVGTLSDEELIALILGTGTSGKPVQALARELLSEAGDLLTLAKKETAELERLPGLGPALATRLLASMELGKRMSGEQLIPGSPLAGSKQAARHFAHHLIDGKREEFHAILLDAKHRVIGSRLISIGSLQSSIVHPREVFRPAIALAASAIIVGHNHPSGDPTPSSEDRAVTERLREVGHIVGIRLLDHLVLGAGSFFSLAEDREVSLREDWIRGVSEVPDS